MVAIAQDEDENVYTYLDIPEVSVGSENFFWLARGFAELVSHPAIIEWDSDDWTKCIVTINDLKDEKP